jgi:hypothetical protein
MFGSVDTGGAAGPLSPAAPRPADMIPRTDEPDPRPRRFSAEVETRLLDALVECEERVSSTSAVKLERAIAEAAREARDNRIQVEDLVIAFKQVEDQATRKATASASGGNLRPSRVRIIKALLDAYYK